MNDLMKMGKKMFTVSVVVLTIVWSMGLAAFLPAVVMAVDCPELEAGDLFKVPDNTAVYLLNADMERMYFPNSEVYHTWYEDFSGVQTIANTCVDAYPAPSSAPYGVNYRSGSRLVKVTISPSVYVIEPNNTKSKIASEAVAKALYGDNWAKLVRDVADVYWPNYVATGSELTEATLHDGMLVKKTGETTVYTVVDGSLYAVDGTLGNATKNDVRTVSATVFGSLSVAGTTRTAASLVENPAQTTSTGGTGTVTPVTGGDLSVSLAADTPAAATLADGTAYNNMLKLNLSASGKDVVVKGLTITRTGLIANTSVSGVSVWDRNGNRHGDVMTSFNSNNQVTIGFGANPILVAKGTTETVTVAFNLDSAAQSGTVGARVDATTGVSTNGTVTGAFPISGNIMTVVDGAASLSAVTVAGVAVGGNSASTDAGNVEIGETKEIAKFRFTETSGRNDITVNKLTFYLEGTLKDKDFKDFTVVAPDNTVLGSAEWSSDRYVTVNLTTPYTVPKSNNRVLTLKATVNDGSGNWVRAHLQNDYDVMVKDAALGYHLVPTSFTDQTSTGGYFKVKSGTLTVSKATDSTSGNISAGATDVVLAKFNLKAVGEDLEIRKMGIKIATTAGSKDLSGNVIVRVGGETLLTFSGDYAAALYSTGSQRNLSQYLTVKSGETKVLEVVANIDSAANADTYQVSIGNFYAKRMSTLDYADNLPTSGYTDATANQLTVQATSMQLVKDTSMGAKTVAAGANAVIVGQYLVKAGSAEGVRVTNLSVEFQGAASNAPTTFQNLELWDGSTQLGSTVSSVATSSNSFSFSLNLAKNEAKVLKLKANVLSTAAGATSSTVSSYTYIGSSTSNIESVSTPVGGQVVTISAANVILSAVSDSTTVSRIYTTSDTPVQLGKWKLEAQNEDVVLKKLTLSVKDGAGAIDTTAGNYGTLYLYDSTNMTTHLATASYVAGAVQFTGFEFPVAASTQKFLVLKGSINGSGTMDSASVNLFTVTSDASTNLEVYSGSGSLLDTDHIDAVAGVDAANNFFATTTAYLFHDAYPKLEPVNVTSLELAEKAQVFKFTVTNEGTRPMRFASTTVAMTVTGLVSNGTTATGTINTWKLYEANTSGGLGTLLAENSNVGLDGGAGGSYTVANTLDVAFGEWNDTNSMLADFSIAPGTSRTFVVTADTRSIGLGKGSLSSFTVQVSGSITGTNGQSSGNTWNTGNFFYHYTPVNGVENTTAYSQADTYNVTGNLLTRNF